MEHYEESTLNTLTQASDNYLDDDKLIRDLENSTKKSTENQVLIAETVTEIEKINASREEYRPLAKKVSKYFFVLYSMNRIENMYEFSLNSYITLFEESIAQCSDSRGGNVDTSEERVKIIDKTHLERILYFANQSLFEKHKLLFAFQLTLSTIFSNDEEIKRDLEKKGMGSLIAPQGGNKPQQHEDDEDDLNKVKKPKKAIPFFEGFNKEEFKMFLNTTYDQTQLNKPQWLNDKNAWLCLVS